MDLPGGKDYAKGKWRAGHKGSHQHGKGKTGTKVTSAAADDTANRQLGDDVESLPEQDEWGMEAGVVDDHEVPPQSQGADLAELLEQAQLQYEQSFYRFRGMQEELLLQSEPPPGEPTDEELTVDLDALAASLSCLPLHVLLGVPKEYTQDLPAEELQELCPTQPPSARQEAPVQGEQRVKLQPAAGQSAQHLQPHVGLQQQSQQSKAAQRPQGQTAVHPQTSRVAQSAQGLQGSGQMAVQQPAAKQARLQQGLPQPQPQPQQQQAQPVHQVSRQPAHPAQQLPDNDDDFLDTLLQDSTPGTAASSLGRSPVSGWGAPASGSPALSSLHSSSNVTRQTGQPALGARQGCGTAAAGRAAQGLASTDADGVLLQGAQPGGLTALSTAAPDDDLDELLKAPVPGSLGPQPSKPTAKVATATLPGQNTAPPAKAPAQSLEDWLGI